MDRLIYLYCWLKSLNLWLFSGVIYVLAMTILVLVRVGNTTCTEPSVITWKYAIGILGLTGIPLLFGFFGGIAYAEDKETQ